MMRVAKAALSAFLSMALVVGMAPDCAYARVAAQALHLGASQASLGAAGDAPGEAQDGGAEAPAPEGAPSGEPAPADTGEVADGDAGLQSAAPEEGFSYRQASGGVEVTGYAGGATELSIPEELGGSKVVGIANSALSGHTSLRSVEVPGSVGTLGAHSFDGCTSLASVRFSASLESTGGEMPWFPGPFEDSGLSSAKLVPGSTCVAPGAFRGCDRLASVEVPGTDASMDPSGTVVDAATGEPAPGAGVTLWYAPLPGVDPEPWDASPWGQENPLATDGGGRFSWEVPEGWWQVRVEAEGYWPAQSEWVRMPAATEPDLQIGLRPASLPQPGGAACADCSVAPGPSARLGRVA